MKLTFNLFLLELKRTLKFLPRLILCAAVIFAFLFAVLYIGEKNGAEQDQRVKIGYYDPDNDDTYIPFLVNAVNEMESVKTICVLEKAGSEQDVRDGIKSGKYYGGVIFPNDYVRGIMHGNYEPAKVIVPGGNNNALFRRLVAVGSDMLVSVQAGIYSLSDSVSQTGKTLSKSELLGINMEFARLVMSRNKLFSYENWSPYEALDFARYYCVML